jgi:Zn-dependent membrane protease YugP
MYRLNLLIVVLLFIPIGLVWWTQTRVQSVFREADQIENAEHISGQDAARQLLDQSGLHAVPVVIGEKIWPGDAYDPLTKRLLITPRTAWRHTDLSVGIVGHEVGHATQDAEGFPPLRLRTTLARWLVQLAWVSPLVFIGGFFLGIVPFMWVAVGIMGLEVVYALVTLPVEMNASRRAVGLLERGHVIVMAEERIVRRVLRAAAFTYLASAGMRVAFFLFWLIILAATTGLRLP